MTDLRVRIIAREMLIGALRHLGGMQPLLPVDFRFLAAQLGNQQRCDQLELEKLETEAAEMAAMLTGKVKT